MGDVVTSVAVGEHSEYSGYCSVDVPSDLCAGDKFAHDIRNAMAGRAAVELAFGEVELGASEDLYRALQKTREYLGRHGGKGFAYLYPTDDFDNAHSPQDFHDVLHCAREILAENYRQVSHVLQVNRPLLDALVEGLMNKDMLLYDEVQAILAQHPVQQA